MSFISIWFVFFVLFLNLVFYCVPVKYRNMVLVAGSLLFVLLYSKTAVCWLFFSTISAFVYGVAVKREKVRENRIFLFFIVAVLLLPLFMLKYWLYGRPAVFSEMIVPIGISFYTLSLISYVVDVFKGKYPAENSFKNFFLFTAFFPHIVQGPIARYDKLSQTLFDEHRFSYQKYTYGWQMVLWGYVLKFLVADKAGVIVNTVYDNYQDLQGLYIVTAVLLYSIQLYADFSGCVNIATGVAQTFGIELQPNFRQPYFADSIQDFWRRWHMTLSVWLRDYVYIPLGGNRKGKIRKYLNIMIVFCISGIWHGAGLTYLLWGALHGFYQAVGGIAKKTEIEQADKEQNTVRKIIKICITFVLVTFAWMLFRAESISQFAEMVKGIFSAWNPEVILDGDAYYKIGLSRLQTVPLAIGIILFFVSDILHEKGISVRQWISLRPMPVRWGIYLTAVLAVLIFGTYGPAYADNQFIYGRF